MAAFISILLMLSGVVHLQSLNMFCFQFQRLQSSRIFFAFGIIFRITIAHFEFKIIESNGFKFHRAAVAGPYAFLVGPYGFFRPC